MTNYRHNNLALFAKNRSVRLRHFWVALSVGFLSVTLIAFIPVFRHATTSGFVSLANPLWQLRLRISRGTSELALFTSKRALIDERETLEKENERLKLFEIENKALQQENKQLRSLLNVGPENERSLSATLTRPSQSAFDTIMIEGGNDRGFQVGNIIFANNFVVLGRIVEIYARVSKVVLFSSANVKTQVLVGENSIALTALGHGGQNFIIKLPEGALVSRGDLLILPGLERTVLGVVGDITPGTDETTKTLIARSPVNMQELRFVLVSNRTF